MGKSTITKWSIFNSYVKLPESTKPKNWISVDQTFLIAVFTSAGGLGSHDASDPAGCAPSA